MPAKETVEEEKQIRDTEKPNERVVNGEDGEDNFQNRPKKC